MLSDCGLDLAPLVPYVCCVLRLLQAVVRVLERHGSAIIGRCLPADMPVPLGGVFCFRLRTRACLGACMLVQGPSVSPLSLCRNRVMHTKPLSGHEGPLLKLQVREWPPHGMSVGW